MVTKRWSGSADRRFVFYGEFRVGVKCQTFGGDRDFRRRDEAIIPVKLVHVKDDRQKAA